MPFVSDSHEQTTPLIEVLTGEQTRNLSSVSATLPTDQITQILANSLWRLMQQNFILAAPLLLDILNLPHTEAIKGALDIIKAKVLMPGEVEFKQDLSSPTQVVTGMICHCR